MPTFYKPPLVFHNGSYCARCGPQAKQHSGPNYPTGRAHEGQSMKPLLNIPEHPLPPPRWRDISACSRAALGPIARRATYARTRKRTVASTPSCATSRAAGRPSSPPTAWRSMCACTPRRSPSSVTCRAAKRPSTRCTGGLPLEWNGLLLSPLCVIYSTQGCVSSAW